MRLKCPYLFLLQFRLVRFRSESSPASMVPQQPSRALSQGGEDDDLLLRFLRGPHLPLEKLSEDPGTRHCHLSYGTLLQLPGRQNRRIGLSMPFEADTIVLVVHVCLVEGRGDPRDYKAALYRLRLSRIVYLEEWTQWRLQMMLRLSRTRCGW